MKKSMILAAFFCSVLPLAMVAQEPTLRNIPLVNQTPKEERAIAIMKTNPTSPSIILPYTKGTSQMNVSSKEALKMPVGEVSTAVVIKRRDRLPIERRMNLSTKEKMRLGL